MNMDFEAEEGLNALEEEEDWNDTRWAVPQSDPLTTQIQSDGDKTCPVERDDKGITTVIDKSQRKDGLMSRMEINDHKAGMEGLDREKINQIILEASKGSRFFENEKKKEEQVNKRIEDQKKKLDNLTDLQIQQGLVEIDKMLEELEETRDLSHSIVHVDMDAFYAAVEERDDPSLKDKPMAVGGLSMLSTSNYHARKFGVRAGMPGFIGRKLCPELVLVPLNFEKYTAVSHEIREVMRQYDPNFCPMSLDEAYLDFTDHMVQRAELLATERTFFYRPEDDSVCCCIVEDLDFDYEKIFQKTKEELQKIVLDVNENGNITDCSKNEDKTDSTVCAMCMKQLPAVSTLRIKEFSLSLVDAVNEMRFRIHQKTKLTASAGIAPNSMLAKVCSDKNKPNGQFMVQSSVEAVKEFIRDLSIRKISGIGKVSEKMLIALGIKTCSDLHSKRGILYRLYSNISFNYFMRISLGIGSTQIARESSHKRKSYSNEQTFGEISKPAELFKKCLELCESLSEGLKQENIKGRTVTLKIKTVKFEVRTKAQSLMTLTNDLEPLYAAARDLLRSEIQAVLPQPLRLRLMGVRLSNLVDLDDDEHQKQGSIKDIIKKMQTSPQKPKDNSCKTQGGNSQCHSGVSPRKSLVVSPPEISHIDEAANCYSISSATNTPKLKTEEAEHFKVAHITQPSVTAVESGNFPISRTSPAKNKNTYEITGKFKTIQNHFFASEKGVSDAESNPTNLIHISDETDSNRDFEGLSISSSVQETKSNPEPFSINTKDDTSNLDAYECPVCGKLLTGFSANKINLHVDKCLSSTEWGQNDGDHNRVGASCSFVESPKPPQSKKSFFNDQKSTRKASKNIMKKKTETPKRNPTKSLPPADLASMLICPVCDLEQDTFDLVAFNQHVDSCLSKSTIRQLVRQQDSAAAIKRPISSGKDTDTPPKKKIRVGTIDSFFKK